MLQVSDELKQYLSSTDPVKQVLVILRKPEGFVVDPKRLVSRCHPKKPSQLQAGLVEFLSKERERDKQIEFNPLMAFDQIAVTAPTLIIEQIANRTDVEEVIPDEPIDMLANFRGPSN